MDNYNDFYDNDDDDLRMCMSLIFNCFYRFSLPLIYDKDVRRSFDYIA